MARTHERITGRTFVITGASSGLGRGTALQLAACGANLVLAARREDLLQEVAAECQAAGAATLVVPTDVASPAQVEDLAAQAIDRFGGIDTWINNAGIGALGPFWDIPLSDHSRVIDVNLKGALYGSHVAVRHFRERGRGTLVNIGSIDSAVPLAYQSSYAAAKGGVLSLGRLLNEELRLDGQEHIKVATVMPWAVDTPWWEHAANYSGGTPRMAAMDDPDKVVEAIVGICVDPKEAPQVTVGDRVRVSARASADDTSVLTGVMAVSLVVLPD